MALSNGSNPLKCQCLHLRRMQGVKMAGLVIQIPHGPNPGTSSPKGAYESTGRYKLSVAYLMLPGAASFGLASRTGAALSS